METYKKFAIAAAILMILAIILTLLAVNFNGWGDAVSGVSAPLTSGLTKIGAAPLQWAQSNGYFMLIFYLAVFLALPLGGRAAR